MQQQPWKKEGPFSLLFYFWTDFVLLPFSSFCSFWWPSASGFGLIASAVWLLASGSWMLASVAVVSVAVVSVAVVVVVVVVVVFAAVVAVVVAAVVAVVVAAVVAVVVVVVVVVAVASERLAGRGGAPSPKPFPRLRFSARSLWHPLTSFHFSCCLRLVFYCCLFTCFGCLVVCLFVCLFVWSLCLQYGLLMLCVILLRTALLFVALCCWYLCFCHYYVESTTSLTQIGQCRNERGDIETWANWNHSI